MANLITHKRSSISAAVPAPGDLELGEIAINTTDKLLFIKDGSNNVVALNNTDNIVEGSNEFYTDAKVRAAISVTDTAGDGALSYNPSTGEFTYAGISDAQVRSKISATGDLAYNPATGEMSYTAPTPPPPRSWTIETTAYTAAHRDAIAADTTAGIFTVTLPATPTLGDTVLIHDVAGNFSTNNLTVDRNGELIMGLAADLTLSTDDETVELVYINSTAGWRVI